MSWVDNEFAERFLMDYDCFKKVSQNPLKLNARCMVCGDSASDEHKARFWIYYHPKADMLLVNCFNCNYSTTFNSILREYNEPLYREYLLERRKDSINLSKAPTKPKEVKPKQKFNKPLKFCTRLDLLPNDHPIVKYAESRRIPKNKYHKLYFTTEWRKLVNSFNVVYKNDNSEPRLVIPIYKDKELHAFQGRALRSKEKQKYITIKANQDATKIYGIDDAVDDNVIILEGPLDSLFIDNSIAITGGTVDLNEIPFKNRIWCLDNEPRHPDTLNRMQKLIDQGERICIWGDIIGKDINDMVKNGYSTEYIRDHIISNSYSGLRAQLMFKRFKKL